MATTTAIVTAEGLAITPEVMERFELRPGDKVTVTIDSLAVRPHLAEIERLIRETPGMLGGPYGLAEELMLERREEDKNSKW
jgi:predicted lysophospholipase L1 biosynthesis ABC-type transport system permease subunit